MRRADMPAPERIRATPTERFFDMKAVLDFEQSAPVGRVKEEQIRRTFRVAPARYYQRLGRIIHQRDALEYAPHLVHRLLALEEQRAMKRAERTKPHD
jgi:hypothetical protein